MAVEIEARIARLEEKLKENREELKMFKAKAEAEEKPA